MPLELIKFKKLQTGRTLGHQITELPLDTDEIVVILSDTTSLNSGVGKKGGACYWYQEFAETSSTLVVMCRLHSLECISGVVLEELNVSVFGSTPKCEVNHSATVESLQTI